MSQFILRDYQQQASDKSVAFLTQEKPENGIVVCPCGGGKSLIIADVVSRLPGPALVFQPSKELLDQNANKLRAYGFEPAIYSASAGQKRVGGRLTLATIGSVVRHPEKFQHVRYILLDEAHGLNPKDDNSMFMRFLDGLPDVRLCGYSATPYRLHSNSWGSELRFITRTRPRVFSRVVDVVQNGDLFRDGYLARLEYKVVKSGFRADRLRLNSTGADYTDESVKAHFRELNFQDQIVRCIRRLDEIGRRGTLVFTRFVEEARYVASQCQDASIVSADTPSAERRDILEGFKAGRIRTVTNVGVLVCGFDYPELANVILARPTMSLALFYQMVGRCIRPHPSKASAFVIDMVGLVERFGRVEDLVITCGPHEKWQVESLGRPLTNVYFGDAPNKWVMQAKASPLRAVPGRGPVMAGSQV